MTVALFAGVLFLLIILMGAPLARSVCNLDHYAFSAERALSRKVTETSLLAAFLSLLAFMPSAYALSAPFSAPPAPASKTMVQYTWIRLFTRFEYVV